MEVMFCVSVLEAERSLPLHVVKMTGVAGMFVTFGGQLV